MSRTTTQTKASRAKKVPVPVAALAEVPQRTFNHDHDFEALGLMMQATFQKAIRDGAPLFTTDAANLWDTYLIALPGDRQYHTCNTCRHFIQRFGSLVTINPENGNQTSAVWPASGDFGFYNGAVNAMRWVAENSRVTGVFLTAQTVLGIPETGPWTHFAVRGAKHFTHALLTPGQAAAAKREDFKTLTRALSECKTSVLKEALRVLDADAVNQAEKFVGPVKWLLGLHDARSLTRSPYRRNNILWRALATAPEGYCHPRSSVIGTLLEDIEAGLPFKVVQKRFNDKVHGLRYQRPQAPPAAGTIEAAEKIVEKMGIAPSLERRFARLEDLETIWLPAGRPKKAAAGGVFGHIKAKQGAAVSPSLAIPTSVMTWIKFATQVLPNAEAMEMFVPAHGSFIGLTTAVHPDAPPILKWDREDRRNPVAWYCYNGGSLASQWGLRSGWHKVSAVTPLPCMWGDDPQPHMGDGAVLILNGAKDASIRSLALFPETLREELHAVRSVIEAHSRSGRLTGVSEASACGYDIRKGSHPNVDVRALVDGQWTSYKIDRWD